MKSDKTINKQCAFLFIKIVIKKSQVDIREGLTA